MRLIAERFYPPQHIYLPNLVKVAARRMITDEEPRQYDDNALGAQQLAFAVFEAAYGRPRGSGSEQPPKRPAVSVSPSLPFSGGIHSASTSTFDYLSGLASSVPVPKTVGDHGSRKVRAKVQEHMHERPVTEGMQEAFTGRAEALTRRPQDPRKVGDLLPWADYYFNAGGSKDLQRTVDLAASKMSREEALKFKEDFERLQFDKQMKAPPQPGRA